MDHDDNNDNIENYRKSNLYREFASSVPKKKIYGSLFFILYILSLDYEKILFWFKKLIFLK